MSVAEIKITIEVLCPHCESYNRFHDLSSVHGNTKRAIQNRLTGHTPVTSVYDVPVKCEICSRPFQITNVKVM